jgi:hypothetical protein
VGQSKAAAKDVDRRSWIACVAWMLAALRPEGPYPILLIRGENGSGKSTLARAITSIIDPRRPDLRALPREPRDLVIRAEHVHVLTFDNVSTLSGDMSDALCRMATGDGFDTRALHSDRELVVFDASRPMLMTSIADAVTRPDLFDRSLIIDLPTRAARRNDAEIRAAVERRRPEALGALLYAASRALGAPQVTISDSVRMRAGAMFAMQAAPALGIGADAIERAYIESRAAAHAVAGDEPLVDALLAFLSVDPEWAGTATRLLNALDARCTGRRPDGWPSGPMKLVAQLRRLAPTLRAYGIEYIPSTGPTGPARERVHRLKRSSSPP